MKANKTTKEIESQFMEAITKALLSSCRLLKWLVVFFFAKLSNIFSTDYRFGKETLPFLGIIKIRNGVLIKLSINILKLFNVIGMNYFCSDLNCLMKIHLNFFMPEKYNGIENFNLSATLERAFA